MSQVPLFSLDKEKERQKKRRRKLYRPEKDGKRAPELWSLGRSRVLALIPVWKNQLRQNFWLRSLGKNCYHKSQLEYQTFVSILTT